MTERIICNSKTNLAEPLFRCFGNSMQTDKLTSFTYRRVINSRQKTSIGFTCRSGGMLAGMVASIKHGSHNGQMLFLLPQMNFTWFELRTWGLQAHCFNRYNMVICCKHALLTILTFVYSLIDHHNIISFWVSTLLQALNGTRSRFIASVFHLIFINLTGQYYYNNRLFKQSRVFGLDTFVENQKINFNCNFFKLVCKRY